MSRDQKLKEAWEQILKMIATQFGEGEQLNLDAIIYLIGVQELGKGAVEFKKDDKVIIKHQRDQGVYTVVEGFRILDKPIILPKVRLNVTGYVIISNSESKELGYWPENLELVE